MESRLDFLEGRVEEQSINWERLFGEIGRLDQKIDLRAETLSTRIETVRLELDKKLESKIDALSDKIDRHFMWLVGIQIAALVAIIGALVRR